VSEGRPVPPVAGRPLVVAGGRQPFEVAILCAAVVIGGLFAVGVESPNLAELLPRWVAPVWAAVLALGAGVALVGLWRRDLLDGLLIERAGLYAVAAELAVYAVAVLITGWPRGIVVGTLIAAIAVAAAVRVAQIHWDVRRLRAALSAANGEDHAGWEA